MKPALLLVSILALVGAVTIARAADKSADLPGKTNSLSIATYNILYLNQNLPAVEATIRQADADLVALQETNAESERFVRQQLGGAYPHIIFRPSKGRSNGLALLSRYPLADPEFLGPNPESRGGWSVSARVGTNEVRLIVVHLTTPEVLGGRSLSELIKAFGACEQIHRRELAPILARIIPGHPAIVLGDFNSFSFGVAVTTLVEHGLIDSFAAVTPDPERHPTWKYAGEGTSLQHPPARIDYILHTPSFRTISSQVLRGPGSDHSLVTSRLEFLRENAK